MSLHRCRAVFGVATAICWLQDWRVHGRAAALRRGGDLRSHQVEAFAPGPGRDRGAGGNIILVELAELLEREHLARFAPSTILRFLARHQITLKKTRPRSEQQLPT